MDGRLSETTDTSLCVGLLKQRKAARSNQKIWATCVAQFLLSITFALIEIR